MPQTHQGHIYFDQLYVSEGEFKHVGVSPYIAWRAWCQRIWGHSFCVRNAWDLRIYEPQEGNRIYDYYSGMIRVLVTAHEELHAKMKGPWFFDSAG